MKDIAESFGEVVAVLIFLAAATIMLLLFNYTSDITTLIREDFKKNSVSEVNVDAYIAEITEEKTYTTGEAARQLEAGKIPAKINGVSVDNGKSYYYYAQLLGAGNTYKREYVIGTDGSVTSVKYQKVH